VSQFELWPVRVARIVAYLDAVEGAFRDEVDYAQLQKIYGAPSDEEQRRYSPARCIGCDMTVVSGNPDPKHASTSFVERQNLTMRMGMRRFTRLTNAFFKKIENHGFAVALHFVLTTSPGFTRRCESLQRWPLDSQITFGRFRKSRC
jgi:hypothetical protein